MENKMAKAVLITGTSSGLGHLLTQFFLEKGWLVFATSRNPEGNWQGFSNVKELELDVSSEASVEKAINQAIAYGSKIDVVINNAGVAIVGPLEYTPEEAIKKIVDVNVLGPTRVIKKIIPQFRRQGYGKIINVSSLIGLSVDIPLASVYAMSKFAVEGLSEGLFYELKALNIDLHLVEPGGFKSSLIDNALFFNDENNTSYRSIADKLQNAVKSKSENADTPFTDIKDVITTIYQLAIGKKNSFRNPIGDDTARILKLREVNSIDTYLTILSERFL